ncbi:MAG: glycosyltransferase [Mycobacteriaceae bacterium]
MLASTFPAGVDDGTPGFVRDLAVAESVEFDTTVLVPSLPGCPAQEWVGEVDVRRFRYFPRRWEDLADGAILENVRRRRSRLLQVPALLTAEVFAVARAVRRLRPDVVHAHWIIPQGFAALLAARGAPLLVTTLGGDVYGLTDPVSRLVIRRVLRRARHVTTMNTQMRQRLLDLGARPERTHVLPMGADVTAIRRAATGVERVPNQLLFVGRLVEKKGLAVLLEAMPAVVATRQVALRVVGDGPLRARLTDGARALPVRFVGAVAREQLAREYAAASVVVAPSVAAASGDQDGLPVALLEALACGCAVVASDLPGLRDVVTDGVNGLIVAPGDAAALAAAVARLLDDAPLRERLGAAAATTAEEYSVDALGARYRALLHTTMDESPRRTRARNEERT